MGNFISMVSINSVDKFISANKIGAVNVYDAVAICEFGMTKVLEQVAASNLLQYEPEHTPKYFEALNEVIRLQDLFVLTVSDEQKTLLSDIESAQALKEIFEYDQHYIDGFLAGYRFLREITKLEKTEGNE
jgi:hypothetical protein